MTSGRGTKEALREQVLRARSERTAEARAVVADAVAAHLLAAPVARTGRVACYLSTGTEPGTGPLITGLLQRGVEVIVPVTGDDHGLDWVSFDADSVLRRSAIGVPEPEGPRLGVTALSDAGLVVVPALAVDHAGHRLGRGGGYYDRALAEVSSPICAVVHAGELREQLPHRPHDVRVQMAVTETGLFRVPSR